jgi:quercetin dioxygenase-like cupin family protein
MSTFAPLATLVPTRIWDGVLSRSVHGQSAALAVVELSAGSVVDMHQHPNEQIGIVLRGSLDLTIGAEQRTVVAGDTYNIPPNIPHRAVAGQDGCVVIDVFSPPRSDWHTLPTIAPQQPAWP